MAPKWVICKPLQFSFCNNPPPATPNSICATPPSSRYLSLCADWQLEFWRWATKVLPQQAPGDPAGLIWFTFAADCVSFSPERPCHSWSGLQRLPEMKWDRKKKERESKHSGSGAGRFPTKGARVWKGTASSALMALQRGTTFPCM